jgi:5-methylthioadenosine/S-adenosylhomocysteine deaminase
VKYVLKGTIITFNEADQIINDGYICIDGKQIVSVAESKEAIPDGFYQAVVVETNGYIYPGLIDLHNHLPYNFLPLWKIDRAEPFADRYEWPRLKNYELQISRPTNLLAIVNGVELAKYCEVKSLIGGVTTIDGYSKFKGSYAPWLLRNVEEEPFGSLEPPIFQSVQPLKKDEFTVRSQQMDKGNAFIYHLAEGKSIELESEYDALKSHSLIRDKLVAIHCNALRKKHFLDFGKTGVKMVWSPLSNMLLYGSTARVVYAKSNGVLICLGPDWTPTGSKNLLWELKVADLVNKKGLGKIFSDKDLVDMVIINPAKAIKWDDRIGRIAPSYMADILVTEKLHKNPYTSLIKANEKHIKLVTIEGRPRFGDIDMLKKLVVQFETMKIGEATKGIDILEPNSEFGNISIQQVKETLSQTLKDPRKAAKDYKEKPMTFGFGEAPALELEIEEIGVTPIDEPNVVPMFTIADVLDKVIGMTDEELKSFPSKLDPLSMYEDKATFIQTLKANKIAPKYIHDLEKIINSLEHISYSEI